MNGLAPPKEAGGTVNAAHSKLTTTRLLRPPTATIKRVWQWEAARLFNEYWRTGNQRHLAAFVRHVSGMRSYEARGAQ